MALKGSSLGTGKLRALGVLGAGPTVGARGAQVPAHEGPTVENYGCLEEVQESGHLREQGWQHPQPHAGDVRCSWSRTKLLQGVPFGGAKNNSSSWRG